MPGTSVAPPAAGGSGTRPVKDAAEIDPKTGKFVVSETEKYHLLQEAFSD